MQCVVKEVIPSAGNVPSATPPPRQGVWRWHGTIWATFDCGRRWEGERGLSRISLPFRLPQAPMAQGWKLLPETRRVSWKIQVHPLFLPVLFSNDSQSRGTLKSAFRGWIQIIWQTFLAVCGCALTATLLWYCSHWDTIFITIEIF